MTATEEDSAVRNPQSAVGSRSRRIYVWWGVSLAVLLVGGLFCWLFIAPVMRARAILPECSEEPVLDHDVAVKMLGGPKRAAHALRLYLRTPDSLACEKQTAVYLLGRCGHEGVAKLVLLLTDRDSDMRQCAAGALSNVKPFPEQAVASLLAVLRNDEDWRVRSSAASALGGTQLNKQAAGAGLLEALEDNDFWVRCCAAGGLAEMGIGADRAVPVLIRELGNDSWPVGPAPAVEILGAFGPRAKAAIPALEEELSDTGLNNARQAAAEALGEIGPAARSAVPALEKLLHDEDPDVRRAATEALKRIQVVQAGAGQAVAPEQADLEEVMTGIVASDWQTAGQWLGPDDRPPYAKDPPADFVRQVMKKCTFRKVDLDGDGKDELIVDLDYSPGQKGNRSFYVLLPREDKWVVAGVLDGNQYKILPRQGAFSHIETIWYGGGHEYVTTRYRYQEGKYVEQSRRKWTPVEEPPAP